MTARRLKKPYRIASEVLLGAIGALLLALAWCYTIEAFTGINPIWILEAIL